MIPSSPSIPLLIVDDPASCRDFWSKHLDFEIVAESMDGVQLDFVLLHGPAAAGRGPVIIEYQRRAGLPEPLAARLPARPVAVVYLWVEGLEPLRAQLRQRAPECLLGERVAPYGAEELFVTDPSGQLFVFGQRSTD